MVARVFDHQRSADGEQFWPQLPAQSYGSLGNTEDADTDAITGDAGSTSGARLVLLDIDDVANLTGLATIAAAITGLEVDDSNAASASSGVSGTLTLLEVADATVVSGAATIPALIAVTDTADVLAIIGGGDIQTTRIFDFQKNASGKIFDKQTISTPMTVARANSWEVDDVNSLPVCSVWVSIDGTEVQDAIDASTNLILDARVFGYDTSDTMAASALVLPYLFASMALTDELDTTALVGDGIVGTMQGFCNPIESPDVNSILGASVTPSSISVVDSDDMNYVITLSTSSGQIIATDEPDNSHILGPNQDEWDRQTIAPGGWTRRQRDVDHWSRRNPASTTWTPRH